jgi:signal transduction histidine kinase
VMLNLVTNAIDAMSGSENRPRQLVIQSKVSNESVEVSVQDTGIGLRSEDLERIFLPFFTTKSKGIGMGLSISRSIIEAHGGRLWASLRDSRGAVFQFTLPKGNKPDD